jgi:hypothetical protein
MEKANPIYIKVEYGETLMTAKEVLSSEIFFLNLINLRRKYNLLKMEEIIIKTKIKRAINRMNLAIKKTQSSFPEISFPRVRKTEPAMGIHSKADESLDIQLKEIQEKLRALNMA